MQLNHSMKTLLKNYKKVFTKYWGYSDQDTPICWGCFKREAVELHHLISKGMGGVKNNRLNRPDNLFPVCRNCHTLAHQNKFVNEQLLPEMKKIHSKSSIKKEIIGEIIGFNREEKSEACEFVSSITGDNSREVVSFGTEAGLFQEIGISTAVCGPGSIEQAHKIDEFIKLEEINKCLNFLNGVKDKSIQN